MNSICISTQLKSQFLEFLSFTLSRRMLTGTGPRTHPSGLDPSHGGTGSHFLTEGTGDPSFPGGSMRLSEGAGSGLDEMVVTHALKTKPHALKTCC